ncbi:alpha/beta hydrolase [Paenibacillus sp. TRM 82003]|uniref:alpha/beta hydrolase n=1 Tax=Kineococcus sp. TRM81007 TaxID=2925831 RepID=UPI001F587C36|nr:alpha/beta hydrolase [Kineococcus sp. TRM81007]MCI2238511.1 alpha/beta hydrolase [Kineococcus sp. TRM81007]MCI3921976.1 alpha/beta hydrolase [Paenibacillus sp. TRM 82003]
MTQLDPQIAQAVQRIAAAGLPPLSALTPAQVRSGGSLTGAGVDPAWWGPVAAVEDTTVPGAAGELPARLYRPEGGDGAPPVVVFFHGGGWVTGDLDTHDGQARTLAAESGALVVSVAYRLAPEHPFPAAPDDAVSATGWVRENAAALGGDPDRVAVAGDSAGGNLAAVAAQSPAGEGLAAQLLVYPAVSGGREFPSVRENASAPVLDADALRWFGGHYRGDPTDVRFAPLDAPSLAGQPPAVVGVAGFDPLRDEGVAYAEALAADGVRVVLRRYDDLVHGFLGMGPVSVAADRAARQLCRDLGELLGTR